MTDYPQAQAFSAMEKCPQPLSIIEQLVSKKERLESELAQTNEALTALQNNPEIARVLTLVGKAIGGRY